MKKTFKSIKEAQETIAILYQINPKATKFIEDSGLKLPKADIPIAKQRGFRFKKNNGEEASIVIASSDEGLSLWVIEKEYVMKIICF